MRTVIVARRVKYLFWYTIWRSHVLVIVIAGFGWRSRGALQPKLNSPIANYWINGFYVVVVVAAGDRASNGSLLDGMKVLALTQRVTRFSSTWVINGLTGGTFSK